MRIAIIGGGPAGSFCAIQLIKNTQAKEHQITIYDSKLFSKLGPPGCNLGAGVIARSMIQDLEHSNIHIPPHVIQCKISGFSFYAEGGERHFKIPEDQTFYSVFRGGGPRDKLMGEAESFDKAILEHAMSLGAEQVEASIGDMIFPGDSDGPFHLKATDGRVFGADVVVGAFGVNSALGKKLGNKGIGYKPPRTIKSFQAEIPLDEEFIAESYGEKIKVLSFRIPGVRFIALTPKKGYVTVTVIGKHAQRADLEWILRNERILRHFPKGFIPPKEYCFCQPKLPVSPARRPYSDRFVVIGDANVSRYYKNGIGSAFMTAKFAAEDISSGRISGKEFRDNYYRKCLREYHRDNIYGKIMFLLNDIISKSQFFSSVHLDVAKKGSVLSPLGKNMIDEILIDLFTGESPYRHIFYEVLSPRLQYELIMHSIEKLGGMLRG
ncbi:MAG: NAD(P)/FAD-dependent oxidoreductase [Candidatus Glassbacteria bacterium]